MLLACRLTTIAKRCPAFADRLDARRRDDVSPSAIPVLPFSDVETGDVDESGKRITGYPFRKNRLGPFRIVRCCGHRHEVRLVANEHRLGLRRQLRRCRRRSRRRCHRRGHSLERRSRSSCRFASQRRLRLRRRLVVLVAAAASVQPDASAPIAINATAERACIVNRLPPLGSADAEPVRPRRTNVRTDRPPITTPPTVLRLAAAALGNRTHEHSKRSDSGLKRASPSFGRK